MAAQAALAPALADHIKTMLVALRMPRALEAVDALVRQLERGEVTALEAVDTLLTEEFTLRVSAPLQNSPKAPTENSPGGLT
jgi:hypothetical protein